MNSRLAQASQNVDFGNHKSPDGKWETMRRPRGLLRYIPSGMFFGRKRYKGKLLFGKLDTTEYKEAGNRLESYINKWKEAYDKGITAKQSGNQSPTTWEEAAHVYHTRIDRLAEMKQVKFETAEDRQRYIRKIEFFWPTISTRAVREIDPGEFLDFFAEAAQGNKRFAPRKIDRTQGKKKIGDFEGGPQISGYNRLLGVARDIVEIAQKVDLKKGLGSFEDPLEEISWMALPNPELTMPTDQEWDRILRVIEQPPGMKMELKLHVEERLFAEFSAMTGARTCEILGFARHKKDQPHPGFRWRDLRKGSNIIHCAKKRKEKWRPRTVPWIDGAEELMDRIRKTLYEGRQRPRFQERDNPRVAHPAAKGD